MVIKAKDVLTIDLNSLTTEFNANKKTALNLSEVEGYKFTTDGKIITIAKGIETKIIKNISMLKYVKTIDDTIYSDIFASGLIDYIGSYKTTKGITNGTNYNDTFENNVVEQNDNYKGGKGTNIVKVYTEKFFGNDTVTLTKGENLKIMIDDFEYSEDDSEYVSDYIKPEFLGNDLKISVYSEPYTYDDKGYPVFDEDKLTGSITVKNYTKKDVLTSSGSFVVTDKNGDCEYDIREEYKNVYITDPKKLTYTASWVKEQVFAEDLVIKDKSGNTITQETSGFEKVKGAKVNLGSCPTDNNYFVGSIYADTLKGGNNNDWVDSSLGNDTYTLGKGENQIYYRDKFSNDTINLTKGENLKLFFANGKQGISYERGTGKGINDLIVTTVDGKVTLKNYYSKETGAEVTISYFDGSEYKIINLKEDALINFDEDKLTKGSVTTSALADYIDIRELTTPTKVQKGVEYGAVIKSLGGNDIIYGSQFNDTITGGIGTNIINYDIDETFGHDVINLTKNETLNLSFTSGDSEVDISALRFSQGTGKNGKNDLIIKTDDDENKSVTLKNYYGNVTGATVFINGVDLVESRILNQINITDNKIKSYKGSALADKIDVSGLTNPTKVKKGVQYGVTINSGAGNDSVTGSDYNDTLNGGAGHDYLLGGIGCDLIKGGAGNDVITGGQGNDKLYGEAGENTFIFAEGDGNDIIYQGKGADTIQFNDINLSALKFEQGTKKNNKDLIIKYGENDSVTVKNYYTVNKKGQITGLNKNNSVKEITSNGSNIIVGTSQNETFYGTEGRDIIFANGGDDVINASAGNDDIHLGSGDSVVKFDMSMLNLEIYNEGTDYEWRDCTETCVKTIYLSDDKNSTVTLDFDKEIFENGCGIFCRGTGQDNDLYISLTNADNPAYSIVIKDYFDENGNPRTNQVKLNIWEYPEMYAEDRVQVPYTVPEYATAIEIPWVRVFDVQPFDSYTGEIHGTNMPNECLLYSAGFGNDTIYGGNGNRELICLHGGNDTVYSNEGTKNVSIWGNQTDVELYLGSEETTKTNINLGLVEGNVTSSKNDSGDLLVSWNCYANATDGTYTSTLRVDKWNDRTSQTTISIGGNNRDNILKAIDDVANTLDGRDGDDILLGGTGVDTFNFTYNSGYGIDTVKNYTSDDILQFESASTSDVDFSTFKYYTNNSGNGLVINTKGLSNEDSYVIIDNYFNSDNKIDKVVAYNWNSQNEERRLSTMYGNKSDLGSFDIATGGEYIGTDNEDILIAKSGQNILTGGKGIDALYSKGGNNTFVFNSGDGSDILYQEGGENTILEFKNATIAQLTSLSNYDRDVNGYWNDLLIHYDDENTLRVKEFYYNAHNKVTQIKDSTGTVYNAADLFKRVE